MFTYKLDNFRVPVKVWMEKEQYQADAKMVEQVEHLAQLPFAFDYIVLCPDGHVGYGMPIGGVLATEGVVIPNAVGVDIGCGMCAVKSSIKAEKFDKDMLKSIMGKVRSVIPVGFNHHAKAQDEKLMPQLRYWRRPEGWNSIIYAEHKSVLTQLGTLGGGNHFIEIQKDNDDNVWIMIHSGSRNLGKKVAEYYNQLAIEMNEKYSSSVPKEWELAFLPRDSDQASDYLAEMQYCVDFAFANRELMMKRVLEVVCQEFSDHYFDYAIAFDPLINIAHNYAQMEHHFGKDVMVHRKGSTLAREGTIGIIPGSQGSKSYIVKGKGNPDSFMSCSHGAGRRMGRNQAVKNLNLEEEIDRLDKQGIIHGIRNQDDLDEATGAYKDIDVVMKNQEDLVEIVAELTPMAVIKG